MLFPTTIVGSFPQPDWLIDRQKLAGRFPPRVRAKVEWALGELASRVRVQRVVGEDHLGLHAAELAAIELGGEVEAVADLVADAAGGAGQRREKSDLQFIGRVRIEGNERSHGQHFEFHRASSCLLAFSSSAGILSILWFNALCLSALEFPMERPWRKAPAQRM